ncbi:hypothetical protein PRZ48_001715 [Zasmidium cellare]|uniref:Uncharacterized protein n=1 Tax=Zasmidium cellare TaxID=395010 RepID=A0ABR0F2Q2_ZASCE|nr:hypothetical protein PRZ48_001715 [Zasmidium cellare]
MDASAFDDPAPDVPDPPLSDIIDLMNDDLKYAVSERLTSIEHDTDLKPPHQIAGAIAIIKHVATLVVLVVALATCVVVYIFTLSWLCLLWLQTRLFYMTAAVLRDCMGEQRSSGASDDNDPPAPPPNTPQDREDPEPEAELGAPVPGPLHVVNPDLPETNGDGISSYGHIIRDDFSSPGDVQQRPHAPKVHSRPQIHEEWRDSSYEGKGKQRADVAAFSFSSVAAAVEAGQAERAVDLDEHLTQQVPVAEQQQLAAQRAERTRAAEQQQADRADQDRAREQRAAERAAERDRAEEHNEETAAVQQKRVQWNTFGDFSRSATFAPSPEASKSGRVSERPAQKKPKARFSSTDEQQPTRPEDRKLSKEEKKAQEQSSWLDQLTSGRSSKPRPPRSQDNVPSTAPPPAGSVVRGFTAEQLADAAAFAKTATKGGHKGRDAEASDKPVPVVFQSKKGLQPRPQPFKPVVMHAGSSSLSSAKKLKDSKSSSAVPTTSASGSTSGWVPPHLRHTSAPHSKQTSLDNSSPGLRQALRTSSTEDNQAATQTDTPAEATGAGNENDAPGDVGDHAEDVEEAPQPQTPEPSRQPSKLSFDEDQQVHGNLVRRVMSTNMLKSWNSPTSSEVNRQAARLQESEGGMLVFRPRPSQAYLDSFLPDAAGSGQTSSTTRGTSNARQSMPLPPGQDPFMTPPPVGHGTSRKVTGHILDESDGEEQESLPQPLPTAAEFEAALWAAQQHRKGVAEQEQEATQVDGAEQKDGDEGNDSSAQPSKDKASIVQQAVQSVQDQAHAKHASTSTYATAPENATPAQQANEQGDAASGRNTKSFAEAAPKGHAAQPSGGGSSRLTPSAPSFFAPTPKQTTATATSMQPQGLAGPPRGLQHPGSINTSGSGPHFGTFSSSPFASTPLPVSIPGHQSALSSAPQPPQYLEGLGTTYGHGPAPYPPSFAPQQGFTSAPFAPPPGLGPVASPAPQYGPVSAFGMPSFAPPAAPPPGPYLAGGQTAMSWIEQDDAVPPFGGPRFQGSYGGPESVHTPFQATPYPASYASSPAGTLSDAPTYTGVDSTTKPPIRRHSRAVQITKPPPARMIDIKSENTLPQIPSAPASASLPVSGGPATTPKPPGLGEPQPKQRQADFDALLSQPSPAGEMLKSAGRAYRELGGMSRGSEVSDRLSEGSDASQTAKEEQLKRTQLGSLRSFSDSMKLSGSDSKQAEDAQQSTPTRYGSTTGGNDENLDPTMKKTSEEGDTEQATAAPTEPQQALVEGDDGNNQEPAPVSSAKRIKREAKRAARHAATEAWGKRETIRKQMVSSYTVDGVIELREATKVYHKKRDELIATMGNNQLNKEDAEAFPRYSDLQLSAPKSLPDGSGKRKGDKTDSPTEAGPSSGAMTENRGESGKVKKAVKLPPNYGELKVMLVNARELLINAREERKQPRPQTNISHSTWKSNIDNKVTRAISYYNGKRKALVAAFGDGELPEDIVRDYPEI